MGLASSMRANSAATNGGFHLRSVSYCEIAPTGNIWLRDEHGHMLACVVPQEAARRSSKRYRCTDCPKGAAS